MMRYLSLFSGIEACTVAWKPLGWECVAVAEIEPFPCHVLHERFGASRPRYMPENDFKAVKNLPTQTGLINFGDVSQVVEQDIKNLGRIDLVVFGSPCFVAGTTVITKDGLKPIEQVKIGDEVITHTNTLQKVLRVGGKSQQEVYEVKASGVLPTLVTGEHPYYVRKTQREWVNGSRNWKRVYSEPTWVEAKDLSKNDLLAIPVIQAEENPLNLTDEECFVIGRYIADGHTRKDFRHSENRQNDRQWQVILSIGTHKLDDFNKKITELNFSCYRHTENVHRVVFSSKRLVEIVENHCGWGAENKYFSQMILNLPKDKLELVIDGYLSGDGCFDQNKYKVTTISEKLTKTLPLAVAKVYQVACIVNIFERPKTTVIQGRIVNQKDTYNIHFQKQRPKQAKYFYENGLLWVRFKSLIKLDGKQDVYNLEVENDNSYTANNLVVHNCQNLSVAGNRKGLQGESSGLFYEAIRLIQYARKHCGLRFALWENVPGSFSSNKGDDFREVVRELSANRYINTPENGWGNTGVALGENGLVEWRVLDAQYFGLAQRRKRVFAIVDFGNWRDRPPILLEPKSLCGDTPPSRETGEKFTAVTAQRLASGGEVTGTLQANCGQKQWLGNQEAFSGQFHIVKSTTETTLNDVTMSITASYGQDGCDLATKPLVLCVHGSQDPIHSETTANCLGRNNGQENVVTYQKPVLFDAYQHHGWRVGETCGTLTCGQNDSIRGDTPLVMQRQAISIAGNIIGRSPQNGGNQLGVDEEVCYTLTTADRHAVAFSFDSLGSNSMKSANPNSGCREVELAKTLDTTYPCPSKNQGGIAVVDKPTSIIRRLTPTECEILQGFPRNYTKIPYRKKDIDQCPDSPRYKALGNSMAVPVMQWIGRKIQKAVAA